MKVEQNKMVGVDYKLTVDGQIADQSRPGQPLEFIFGTGMLLPKFEEAILGKEIGESVSFTLEAKDGYGEVIADAIVDLPKDIFMVDGKLAEDILFEGSQVPMSDAQGNRMMGIVKEVGESTVKMDFNHPMAGKTLNFDVEVVSVRDVTPEDLQGGCSCGECGGDCGEGCGDHFNKVLVAGLIFAQQDQMVVAVDLVDLIEPGASGNVDFAADDGLDARFFGRFVNCTQPYMTPWSVQRWPSARTPSRGPSAGRCGRHRPAGCIPYGYGGGRNPAPGDCFR